LKRFASQAPFTLGFTVSHGALEQAMRVLASSLFLPLILAAGAMRPTEHLLAADAKLTASVAADAAAPEKKAGKKNAAKKKNRVRKAAQAHKALAKSSRHVRQALRHLRISRKHVAHAKGMPATRRTEIMGEINAAMAKLRTASAANTAPPKKIATKKKKR
jgi:hypothetical protein